MQIYEGSTLPFVQRQCASCGKLSAFVHRELVGASRGESAGRVERAARRDAPHEARDDSCGRHHHERVI